MGGLIMLHSILEEDLRAKMTRVLQAKRELVAVKQARLSLAQDEYRDDPPPLAVSYHITVHLLVVKSSFIVLKIVCSVFRIPIRKLVKKKLDFFQFCVS